MFSNSLDIPEIKYRLSQDPGVVAIPNVILPSALTELQNELCEAEFIKAKERQGNAVQNFSYFFALEASGESRLHRFPLLESLIEQYQEYHNAICGTDSTQRAVNEVMVNKYPPGNCGISPHKDLKKCRGLISVFTIAGSADFYTCGGREEQTPLPPIQKFPLEPGTLSIMRGYEGEPDMRPVHYVGEVYDERIAVCLREIRV